MPDTDNVLTEELESGDGISVINAAQFVLQHLPKSGFIATALREISGSGNPMQVRGELARLIAERVPLNLRTKDNLKNLDYRSILHEMAQEEHEEGSDEERDSRLAGIVLTEMNRTLEEDLRKTEEFFDGNDPAMQVQLEGHREVVQDILDQYKDGQFRALPNTEGGSGYFTTDPNTGVTTWQRGLGEDDNPLASASATAATNEFQANQDAAEAAAQFWSGEDVQRLLAGGIINADTLLQIEQMNAAGQDWVNQSTGEVIDHDARVSYDGSTYRRPAPGHEPGSGGPARTEEVKEWYSLTEALSLPGSFSPEERVRIIERMENAGLIPKGSVAAGDTTSQTFKAAWKTLASSAIERNVSMTAFLEEMEVANQKNMEDALAIRLSDPAAIRSSANNIGRNLLGRILSDDEQSELTQFIHELERKNAETEQLIADGEGGEHQMIDIDAQTEAWIEDDNAEEAQAHEMADQYETFTNMLAGPGRGI